MAQRSNKVAISLPGDLCRAIEHIRKRTRQTRSAILEEALREWLKQQHRSALVRQYEEGYRQKPETGAEIEAARAAAVQLLSSVEW